MYISLPSLSLDEPPREQDGERDQSHRRPDEGGHAAEEHERRRGRASARHLLLDGSARNLLLDGMPGTCAVGPVVALIVGHEGPGTRCSPAGNGPVWAPRRGGTT